MKIAVARRNEALDSMLDNANNGILRIYSGTQPANPDTALAGNTLLSEHTMAATAFAPAAAGVATANAIGDEDDAPAPPGGETATFARLFETDGTTAIVDLTVGADLTLSSPAIVQGNVVAVNSLSVTMPEGA